MLWHILPLEWQRCYAHPMPKPSSHILDLAKRGAEVRLRELSQEAKNLIELFPHLRDAFDNDELPVSFLVAQRSGRLTQTSAPARRRRRRLSAAARKAVSARMKRYWAARRKSNAKS
jgi:hypothetical protein